MNCRHGARIYCSTMVRNIQTILLLNKSIYLLFTSENFIFPSCPAPSGFNHSYQKQCAGFSPAELQISDLRGAGRRDCTEEQTHSHLGQ